MVDNIKSLYSKHQEGGILQNLCKKLKGYKTNPQAIKKALIRHLHNCNNNSRINQRQP